MTDEQHPPSHCLPIGHPIGHLYHPHHAADDLTDLQLVRTLSPRLRTSRDEDIERVLEREEEKRPVNSSSSTLDIGPPPDGGREAWLCVAGAFLVMFAFFGFVTSQGQLQAYYLSHQLSSYSKSTVAWISSCQSTLTFLFSIIFGRYFDRHGATLLTSAAVVTSFGALVGLAFSKEYYQFLLSHMLFGFTASFTYSVVTGIAGHWFLRRRSTAVGIIVCGAGLGGIVYPLIIKALTDRLEFRDAILIIAGLHVVLVSPSVWWVKSRLPTREPAPLSALKEPWKETRYAFLVIGVAVFSVNIFSPYFYAPTLAATNTTTQSIVDNSIVIVQAGSFFGRITSGFLADRLGVWRVFSGMGFACVVFLFAFWTGSPIGSVATVFGLFTYGYASGAYISLISATTVSISPTHEIGMRLGMLWSVVGAGLLVGPVVCGSLVSAANGKFTYAGIWCGGLQLVGMFIVLAPVLINWARRGKDGKGDGSDAAINDVEVEKGRD